MNSPGAYLFSETATNFTISGSHPTLIASSLHVNVDRVGTGRGCSTAWNNNGNATDVTLVLPYSSGNAGQSIIVTCQK